MRWYLCKVFIALLPGVCVSLAQTHADITAVTTTMKRQSWARLALAHAPSLCFLWTLNPASCCLFISFVTPAFPFTLTLKCVLRHTMRPSPFHLITLKTTFNPEVKSSRLSWRHSHYNETWTVVVFILCVYIWLLLRCYIPGIRQKRPFNYDRNALSLIQFVCLKHASFCSFLRFAFLVFYWHV